MPQSRIIVCSLVRSSNDVKLQSVYLIRMGLFRIAREETLVKIPLFFSFANFFCYILIQNILCNI